MTPASPRQALEALNWRYATKQFDPQRPLNGDVWSSLLRSLTLAPSSFGLQPWRFLVIDDPQLREKLLAHSWNQPQVTEASRFIVLAARTDVTEADVDRWIACLAAARGAPAESLQPLRGMIAGFAAGMERNARHQWCARQVYLALGQLMTTAAMLGVDTCPLEGIDPAAYDRELGLEEEGFATVVACALGHRLEEDKYATMPKARFPADQVIRTL